MNLKNSSLRYMSGLIGSASNFVTSIFLFQKISTKYIYFFVIAREYNLYFGINCIRYQR